MKRKILSIMLTIMMLASIVPSAFAEAGKYTQDFEDDTILATWKGYGSDFENDMSQYEIVDDADTSKGKVLHAKEGSATVTVLDPALDNVDTSVKTKFSFDFKQVNNGSTSQFRINGVIVMGMLWEQVRDPNGSVISGAAYSAGQWNHAELILDPSTGEITYNITNASGAKVADGATYTFSALKNISKINSFCLASWDTSAKGDTYWDNIVIEKYVEPAPATKVDSYKQDFEGIDVIATLTEAGSTIDTTRFEIVNDTDTSKGKVLHALEGASNCTIVEDNLKNVKIYDKTQISFDFKQKTNGSQSKFIIATDKGEARIGYMMWECMYNDSALIMSAAYTASAGAWNHVDMVLDVATGKVSYTVTKPSGVVTGESTFDNVKGMTKISSIGLQSFNQASYLGETWWDNVEVKEYVEPAKITKYTQDFEDDTILTAWKDYGSDFENDMSQYEIVDDTDTSKGKVLHAKPGSANVTVLNDPNLKAVEIPNKIKVSFDVKQVNNGQQTQFRINGTTIAEMMWESLQGWSGAQYAYGQWNHFEFVIDPATGDVTCTITNANGVLLTDSKTRNFTALKGIKKVNNFALCSWNANNITGETYWDNIVIEKYVAQPKVKSVDFYAGDVKQDDNTNVAAGAKKIVIDFGAEMKADSLKDEITVTGCTFTGVVDGDKYVMTMNDAFTAESAYTLKISADAESTDGKKLGTAYTLDFKANAGKSTFAFGGVKQSGTAVTTFANLTRGAEAEVSYDYTNTTAKAQNAKLIYAYYNGSKLVKCEIVDASVAANEYSGTKTAKFTVDSASDATELNIMLWSDMEQLIPLTGIIKL